MWVTRNRKPGAEVYVVRLLSVLEGATLWHPVEEDSRHSTGWKGDHRVHMPIRSLPWERQGEGTNTGQQ